MTKEDIADTGKEILGEAAAHPDDTMAIIEALQSVRSIGWMAPFLLLDKTSQSNLQNSVQSQVQTMANQNAINYNPTKQMQENWNNMSTLGKLGMAATMASGGVGGLAAGGVNALRNEGSSLRLPVAAVNFNQVNQVPGISPQNSNSSALANALDTSSDTTSAQAEQQLKPPPGIASPAPDTQADGSSPKTASNPFSDLFDKASQLTGIDSSYLSKMAKRESNFNPNASNPNGTASGLMQFTDPTWQNMVKQYGQQYGLTPNGKNDPQQSAIAGALYAKQNGQMLNMSLGIKPTNADLYTAHFLGPQGASTFLRASYVSPDKPVTSVLPASVIAANKGVFLNKDGSPKTVEQVHTQIEDEFND